MKLMKEFFKRGLMAAAGGPVILAIIYYILGATGAVTAFTPQEVSLGVLTITLMAFVAAGVTVVYQAERLPLFYAALIHAVTLYLDYLMIYLLNGWIPNGGIGIFTVIFVAGFLLVWVIISLCIRAGAKKLSTKLQK